MIDESCEYGNPHDVLVCKGEELVSGLAESLRKRNQEVARLTKELELLKQENSSKNDEILRLNEKVSELEALLTQVQDLTSKAQKIEAFLNPDFSMNAGKDVAICSAVNGSVVDRYIPNKHCHDKEDGRLIAYHKHLGNNQRWKLIACKGHYKLQCRHTSKFLAIPANDKYYVYEREEGHPDTELDIIAFPGGFLIKSHRHNTFLDVESEPADFVRLIASTRNPMRKTQEWSVTVI